MNKLAFSKSMDFLWIQSRIKEIAALGCVSAALIKDRQGL